MSIQQIVARRWRSGLVAGITALVLSILWLVAAGTPTSLTTGKLRVAVHPSVEHREMYALDHSSAASSLMASLANWAQNEMIDELAASLSPSFDTELLSQMITVEKPPPNQSYFIVSVSDKSPTRVDRVVEGVTGTLLAYARAAVEQSREAGYLVSDPESSTSFRTSTNSAALPTVTVALLVVMSAGAAMLVRDRADTSLRSSSQAAAWAGTYGVPYGKLGDPSEKSAIVRVRSKVSLGSDAMHLIAVVGDSEAGRVAADKCAEVFSLGSGSTAMIAGSHPDPYDVRLSEFLELDSVQKVVAQGPILRIENDVDPIRWDDGLLARLSELLSAQTDVAILDASGMDDAIVEFLNSRADATVLALHVGRSRLPGATENDERIQVDAVIVGE